MPLVPSPPLPSCPEAAALAIGPEGGWSKAEINAFEVAQFQPAALGANILRAPTAVSIGLGRLYAG